MAQGKLEVVIGGIHLPKKGKLLSPIDDKAVGKRLRQVRLRRGFTQVQIAKKLQIDQAMVSGYERGTARMHAGVIGAFADAFNVSADEILGLKPSKVNSTYRERRFFNRLQQVEQLPRRDKQSLIALIDAYIEKQKRSAHAKP